MGGRMEEIEYTCKKMNDIEKGMIRGGRRRWEREI